MIRTRIAWVAVLACSMAGTSIDRAAGHEFWNQFRGPHGNGHSDNARLPVEFDDQRNVQWKVAIHGKGWSSPVVWGDQVWMTTATEDGTRLSAVAVNLDTGKIEHDLLVFEVAQPEFCHPTNSYASCTPYVEEGRLYVHFGTYGTACIDTRTGKTLWERRDLNCDHFRGPAASAVVHGDVLFLSFDGVDVQFVVGLDKHTGKTIWRQDRNIDYGTTVGDRKKAYSTPAVIRIGDQWQMVSPSAMETIAYDPSTGSELWRVRHGGMNAAARPIYENGLLYLSGGEGREHLVAVRPRGTGDITESAVVWKTGKMVPDRSSQLVVDGRLFMVSDDGVASCLDAQTGTPLWTKRLGGAYWASPVYASGRIYFPSKEGTVVVIEASDKYVVSAKNEFPAGFNASPAIAGDTLILRSYTDLYRIGSGG
jgi:outer membrane protein assembly factor BamB